MLVNLFESYDDARTYKRQILYVTSFFKVHARIRNETGLHPDVAKVKCPIRRK